jgi:hypothetical protein
MSAVMPTANISALGAQVDAAGPAAEAASADADAVAANTAAAVESEEEESDEVFGDALDTQQQPPSPTQAQDNHEEALRKQKAAHSISSAWRAAAYKIDRAKRAAEIAERARERAANAAAEAAQLRIEEEEREAAARRAEEDAAAAKNARQRDAAIAQRAIDDAAAAAANAATAAAAAAAQQAIDDAAAAATASAAAAAAATAANATASAAATDATSAATDAAGAVRAATSGDENQIDPLALEMLDATVKAEAIPLTPSEREKLDANIDFVSKDPEIVKHVKQILAELEALKTGNMQFTTDRKYNAWDVSDLVLFRLISMIDASTQQGGGNVVNHISKSFGIGNVDSAWTGTRLRKNITSRDKVANTFKKLLAAGAEATFRRKMYMSVYWMADIYFKGESGVNAAADITDEHMQINIAKLLKDNTVPKYIKTTRDESLASAFMWMG